MRPHIEETWFGSITVEGERYEHDITIGLKGKVHKRNKKLSKAIHGTSHILSLAEIKDLSRKTAQCLIVGTGQAGKLALSPEAAEYLKKRGCTVVLLPTPKAIKLWNETKGKVLGLFHVTC